MHPNPAFRKAADAATVALIRKRGFGVLAVNAPEGPLLSHIPVLMSDETAELQFHLVRSNPIASLDDVPAVVAVSGPDGYISPDWYEVPDQVPTWNYVAAHVRGHLFRMPQEDMADLLARQSAEYEARLDPKPPWTMAKMTPEVRDRMMRMIVPYRLVIERSDATWKLSQNKDEAVRLRAADAIEAAGQSEHGASLAELMRDPP